MPDLTGQQFGDYQILRRLGRGAMAEVYLAEQMSLARRVALKVLNPELAQDATYVARFQHEARAAAALVHANIVQIYEVRCEQGLHFIAQEYVPGKNLGEIIHRQGRLDTSLALDILRQVAAALHKAAEGAIVHRDIKPENIMLARSGEAKVADFGLARIESAPTTNKLTQVGVTMGTPLYMSPEQIEGRAVDPRSDIYSLGVTAYHALTGEPPFEGDTPLSVAVKHLNERPRPLVDVRTDLPVRFSIIVEKMMAKKPDGRYANPGELLAELRALARQASQEGWAEGPDNWSALDLIPPDGGDMQATRRLNQAMNAAAMVSPPRRTRRRALLALGGLFVAGGLLGLATLPERLLAGARGGPLAKDNVHSQLLHAKFVNTPDAWRAVERFFPDADPYYHRLALEGLARHYLERENFPSAAGTSSQLLGKIGENDHEFRRFALAGLVVSHAALGQTDRARRALAKFPFEESDLFQQSDPQMAKMLREARERIANEPDSLD